MLKIYKILSCLYRQAKLTKYTLGERKKKEQISKVKLKPNATFKRTVYWYSISTEFCHNRRLILKLVIIQLHHSHIISLHKQTMLIVEMESKCCTAPNSDWKCKAFRLVCENITNLPESANQTVKYRLLFKLKIIHKKLFLFKNNANYKKNFAQSILVMVVSGLLID